LLSIDPPGGGSEGMPGAGDRRRHPGRSQVRTDDWRRSGGLDRLGCRRQVVRTSAEVGENPLPLANRLASLLKRWLLSTHAVGVAHLDYYLDDSDSSSARNSCGTVVVTWK
jgi:hypothetical protein